MARPGRPLAGASGPAARPRRARPPWGLVLLLVLTCLSVLVGAPTLAATPDPGTGTASGATSSATPGAAAVTAGAGTQEQSAAVSAWADGEGQAIVRQAVGAGARVEFSAPVAVRTWSEALTRGGAGDPTRATDDWALSVSVDGQALHVLLASVRGGVVTGGLVKDAGVAAAVAALTGTSGTALVHDSDGAWYELSDDTVTAVGTVARAELAGPVAVSAYGEVLRSRAEGTTGDPVPAPTAGTDWTVWATVGGVALAGASIVVLTLRHERRVMAPLRQAPAAGTDDRVRVTGATAVPALVDPAPSRPLAPEQPVTQDEAPLPPRAVTDPPGGAGAPRA